MSKCGSLKSQWNYHFSSDPLHMAMLITFLYIILYAAADVSNRFVSLHYFFYNYDVWVRR